MKDRPISAILNIGGELLKGTVLNTNAQFLGRELTRLGFEVSSQFSCPDEMPAMLEAFKKAFRAADLIILSGGLGPTPDDLTRDALSIFFDSPLVFSEKHFSFIRKYYKSRKKKIPAIVRKEAMFPACSVPLYNRFGIALGFYIETAGKLIVVLPGVPMELENMFQELVKPLILRRFKNIPKRFPVIAKTAGLSEPDVMRLLGKDFFDDPFDFGIYPAPGEVTLRLYAETLPVAKRLMKKIRSRLGKYVYAYDEIGLAEAAGQKLLRQKKTLGIAESCTGGNCAAEVTKIPGASRFFRGGIVAYHGDVKKRIGVSQTALAHGEVSPQTAKELARCARELTRADFGIGVTGIAGPAGATAGKPVGRVYIAVASSKSTRVFEHDFWGSRPQVQTKAVRKAFEHLLQFIK